MNVGELIERLAQYPNDCKVRLSGDINFDACLDVETGWEVVLVWYDSEDWDEENQRWRDST